MLYRIAYTPLRILKPELQLPFKNTEHPEATQRMKVNWRLEATEKRFCKRSYSAVVCFFLMWCGATVKKKGSENCPSPFFLKVIHCMFSY